MEKKIYTTYNQINQDFDVVAMTKTEIKNTKNQKHFLVLLDKKDPRPPKESKIDLLIKEFNDFKTKQSKIDLLIKEFNDFKTKQSKIDLLIEEFKDFKKQQLEFNAAILTRLTNIETRLDNIVKKNNLIE